jgi:hypothetical protein|uniref:Uncharacterized protein n=1 Tax=Eutreptiella gymnastica TaxID=73025 RepID=A0A7S4G9E9_9EUGL|mmetsp:Transcript_99459/g.167700  ORF Transcript_99459/g.167700 Transcript_99459/m.167700 type:complete len:119 (-) Transcript_99459:19-375(-)
MSLLEVTECATEGGCANPMILFLKFFFLPSRRIFAVMVSRPGGNIVALGSLLGLNAQPALSRVLFKISGLGESDTGGGMHYAAISILPALGTLDLQVWPPMLVAQFTYSMLISSIGGF